MSESNFYRLFHGWLIWIPLLVITHFAKNSHVSLMSQSACSGFTVCGTQLNRFCVNPAKWDNSTICCQNNVPAMGRKNRNCWQSSADRRTSETIALPCGPSGLM